MTSVKLEDARRVIGAEEKKATRIGQPMNIAVVDEDGNIVAHVRMDNAWIGSVDVSMKKTAKSLIFVGGIPLKLNGRVVGAIGVSGGSRDLDHAVAAARAAAF